jgi:colanic acid biosynthesis glycosyl transferase WcaI
LLMHILFLTENFPPETNAAATRVFERACYWVRWGHTVDVITSAPNFPQGKLFNGYRNRWRHVENLSGIRVIRVKTYIAANEGFLRRTLDFLSFMVSGSMAGLFTKRPDVVVATSPQFFAAVAGWMIGEARRIPFVFELGDLWPASIAAVGAMKRGFVLRLLEKMELFLYRRAAAVAALTNAFKADLVRRGIAPSKIAVVINGVDLPRYGPRPPDATLVEKWALAGKFVVGYAGTLGMAHGLSNVLDAAEILQNEVDVRFLLVGPGAERAALVDEAARRRLTSVVFGDPQPKELMPQVWSTCDVALVHLKNAPTFAEVIPSKMFEAMAMGLPILLAAPLGEASTILKVDDAGVHVPAGDPQALAAGVMRLKDPGLRARLARQSLAAAEKHTRERQAREMLTVLEAAMRNDAAAVALARAGR